MSASGAQRTAIRLGFADQAVLRLIALAAAAPLLLVVSRLTPSEGLGLGFRLAAAAACVFLVPGALITGAIGWPRHIGTAVAASLSWSLVAVFVAMGTTFLVGGSLTLTLVVLVVIAAAALTVGLVRGADVRVQTGDRWAVLGVALVGCFLGRLVLETPVAFRGDAPFHIGRVRKLLELPALDSLGAVNEFVDGDLHPGYAFPLWHGALALVARLSTVDPLAVQTFLPAVLAPLAFILAYAAGAALFRSWAGGVATAGAEAALFVLPLDGVGSLRLLTDPERASILLLVPALLALLFAYVRDARPALLAAVAAAAFGAAVIHATYVPFLALPLAGFLLARLVLVRDDRTSVYRLGAALAAMLIPAGLFLAALVPTLEGVRAINPTAADRAHEVAHFAGYFGGEGDWLRPEAISRGGGAFVAGLLVAPLAVLAARRLWAALVLGGTLAVLTVALTPFLFGPLADVSSLSQARRLPFFLPLPFALAGAAVLAGRLRLAGVAAALGAGVAFRLTFPGEFSYDLRGGGPAWPVWVALAGSACALVVGALWRRGDSSPLRSGWAALAAVAFVLPTAMAGIGDVHRDRPGDRFRLTPGVMEALKDLEPGTVLLGHQETAYRAAALAPVYIAAGPGAHVAHTVGNRLKERVDDVTTFFRPETARAERLRLLEKYDVEWLLIGPPRRAHVSAGDLPPGLTLVYADGRYRLYRVDR